MTLRWLEFSNLKCFSALHLPLAPLTLFTGFNSAGKSTALQSLLLLAQSLRSNSDPRYLIPNGPLVRLGSPGDVLSDKAKDRQIEILVGAMLEQISWSFRAVESRISALENKQSVFHIDKAVYQIEGAKPREWSGEMWRSSNLDSSSNELIDALKNIIFLNSERGKISAVCPSPGDISVVRADVGCEGQYAPWWYVRATDEEIEPARRHPGESAGSLRRQVDAYLNDLFPGARATADKIEGTHLIRFWFSDGAKNDWRHPANIGYGLTYTFPIIVAILLAKKGQVLIIESPEGHLHPRAQSRMGEMLSRVAATGVQILLESHSDHVLNGIRLAVKQETIRHSDIAVHFFSGVVPDGHGVISPSIDAEGTLDTWPEGFFDQSELDLAALTGWGQSA